MFSSWFDGLPAWVAYGSGDRWVFWSSRVLLLEFLWPWWPSWFWVLVWLLGFWDSRNCHGLWQSRGLLQELWARIWWWDSAVGKIWIESEEVLELWGHGVWVSPWSLVELRTLLDLWTGVWWRVKGGYWGKGGQALRSFGSLWTGLYLGFWIFMLFLLLGCCCSEEWTTELNNPKWEFLRKRQDKREEVWSIESGEWKEGKQ